MRILVAADRPPVRDGVVLAISARFPDAEIRTAADTAGCRHLLERWVPHVALIDAGLPPVGAMPLCARLHEAKVRTLVVVGGAEEALELLEIGVHGVVSSAQGLEGVAAAVQTVTDGHTHVPPALIGGVLQGLVHRNRQHESARDRLQRLSRREQEVLALLGKGRDHVSIARSLAISPHTARTHIRHVMSKLEVSSRVEAAALAADLGLVMDPVGGRP
ncbi:MAG TPA: response regulator transcription factor [Nocardioidaceae bacterium]|nr:response regulator transcription factor [Nocardioidaceae bacterium]